MSDEIAVDVIEESGVHDAFDMYGRIKEGVHIVGYTFERACGHLTWLLEGDRWQLGGRFTDVNEFMASVKLDDFKVLADQRKTIAKRIKELQPDATQQAIATVLGVNQSTLSRDLTPYANAYEKTDEVPVSEPFEALVYANALPPKTADLSGAEVAKLVEKETTKVERREASRTERLDNIAAISMGNTDLPTNIKYPIIYADPPWRYENPPMGGGNRSIENHYPTMTLEEICALPVSDLATPDAMLYMWATAPKLAECMQVIEAWGFDYRTNMVWDKEVIGMGYHARNQHEILLIAKRGEIPPPLAGKQPSSVHRERRGDHSAKPVFYYEMIDAAYPQLPKIELFCRSPRDGWASWGNQVDQADAA